ncbi:hypothetical protein [Asticcacaulis solisilvae]|uniref:hypothetical protein n=1 Tax=Asticcacaulis solisilvae TaxID=1217274 RepID=UPI003FD7D13D
MSHLPPIPRASRSNKGPGNNGATRDPDPHHADGGDHADRRGQQANLNINSHHQGYQQDR